MYESSTGGIRRSQSKMKRKPDREAAAPWYCLPLLSALSPANGGSGSGLKRGRRGRKTIQKNLCHAASAFTLNVYAHVTAQMKKDSAARMEQMIQSVSAG